MAARPRLHLPTVVGRVRTDPGTLLLVGLVVALTTALGSAVAPSMARTSDQAMADAVRDAGQQAVVIGTIRPPNDALDVRTRDPRATGAVRKDMARAQRRLPGPLAAVVQPGIASVTTPALQLLGAGPGRYLSLAYLDGPTGAPRVRYTSGGPPGASVGTGRAEVQVAADGPPWPVQVAVSEPTATALDLAAGDRLTAKDEQGSPVVVRVSGIFVAQDPHDRAWVTNADLLRPAQGSLQGVPQSVGAALVSPASLPDLRLALPADDLTLSVAFIPRAEAVHWATSDDLVRSIASLKSSPGSEDGDLSWDSGLDRVLDAGRAQVASARGQADVLVLALLVCAFLVLWQASDLLVRRRAHSVVLTRERGGTLLQVAAELFVEAAGFAVAGTLLGLLVTRLGVGEVDWVRWLALPLVVASAAAGMAAALAARATDPRRTPANRAARRSAVRARRLRRTAWMVAVVAGAALSFVALRQRGVLGEGDGRGDLTAASAPTWWICALAWLVIATLPGAARLLLDATRRSSGGVAFFAAARVREVSTRVLPLLVVTVTVAQLTFALTLAHTEQRGQAAGALLSVGGDARVDLAPGHSAADLAREVAAAPGVRAAVAAHVEEAVPATSQRSGTTVQLVIVPASAYQRLLAASDLPDAPQLARLGRTEGDRVPALLLGGPSGLRDGLTVRESDGRTVPLEVVGSAPRVQAAVDPVVVVDAERFAAAGGTTSPDTVWAVGPGAAAAARAAADDADQVVLDADALADRRTAPLAAGLVHLAMTSAALLLLFAVLGVLLAAASEAGPRTESLGRLRSLGLRDRQLWGVLVGELMTPAAVGTVVGLLLGVSAAATMLGQLSLERITGQVDPPGAAVPVWVLLSGAVVVATVLVLTQVEWTRVRRMVLGQLLRGGER